SLHSSSETASSVVFRQWSLQQTSQSLPQDRSCSHGLVNSSVNSVSATVSQSSSLQVSSPVFRVLLNVWPFRTHQIKSQCTSVLLQQRSQSSLLWSSLPRQSVRFR